MKAITNILNQAQIKGEYKSVGAMIKDKALWTMFYMQIALLTFLVGTFISYAIK